MGCQSDQGGVITSGGGFSYYSPQPDYQRSFVDEYFATLDEAQVPPPGFNRFGRAYPDVSLVSANYVTINGGLATQGIYGTSCSAPVFAAMLSLINSARLKAGKSTVGFVNPALYLLNNSTEAFTNDITIIKRIYFLI